MLVVLATVAVAVAAPCWPAGPENPQKPYVLNITRKAMTPALQDFSTQTGLNVGFFPQDETEENVEVGPVQGSFTADAGLEALLKGSEFAHEWLNEKSIYVFRLPNAKTAANALKKSEASASTRTERRQPIGWSLYGDANSVTVFGTPITILETDSQSVTVLNQPKIDSYGVSTLGELFEYLPQIPHIKAEHGRSSGEQFADLRGFGGGTTMILINGRRVGSTATSFDYGGFDVNTIPLAAVERVEVLLDAPSVSIGTDTVAGVINVVLKDEITEPIVELRYGFADGGAEERRLSAGIGTTREIFRGTATFDVFQRNPLLGSEREPIRNQDYRRFGSIDYRSLNANPGNIFSLTPANLPGLDASFAAVPIGSSGIDLTPSDLASRAGNFEDLNKESLGRFLSIIPEASRLSLVASAELRLSPSFIPFAEIFATDRKLERQVSPPTLNGAVVPASNAFNPFGVSVAVNGLLKGAPTQTWTTDAALRRAVLGARGDIDRWEWEAAATWMGDRAESTRENELEPLQLAQALASSDPDTALNVFRDGPAGTKALLASLVADRIQQFSSRSAQIHVRAERPLVSLPGGNIRLMLGAEWREEEVSNHLLLNSPHRSVSAAFAEVQAPLIDAEMNILGFEHLAVSVGSRIDDYSDFRSRNTFQYGLVWQPIADLKFRGSYSESYRPPLLYELFAPRASTRLAIPDPRRGYAISSYTATYAGNSDLAPLEGHTWTTGFEFTPRALPDLRLSLGYWRTTLAHQIVPLNVFEVLGNEEFLPGRVIRSEPSPKDVESGMPGALQSIDISWGNFGHLTAAGMDFNASFTYETGIGSFTPTISAAWNDEFTTNVAEGAAPENRIGFASHLGTIPRWRGVASTSWSRDAVSVFLAAQFVPAYKDTVIGRGTTGRTIPSTTILDAQVSLRVGDLVPSDSFLHAIDLTAGVKNILDRGPHFAEAGYDLGYDYYLGDLRQRFWYLRLAKKF